MTEEKRTQVKSTRWFTFPEGLEVSPMEDGWNHGTRQRRVYLDGVLIGTIYRWQSTAEHSISKGSRIVVRGKPNAQVNWDYALEGDHQRRGYYGGTPERYMALSQLLFAHKQREQERA